MTETYVTATDFRSHIAQITNCVAWRHDRVVVTRHGQEIGGFVCHEDLEFLRRYKPLKNRVPSGDVFSPLATWDDAPDEPQQAFAVPPPPEDEPPDVENAPVEEVQAYYDRHKESDDIGKMDWCGRAGFRLRRERWRREDAARAVSPRSEPPCCTESTPEPAATCTTSPS